MNRDLAKVDFVEAFTSQLPEGDFRRGMEAANKRREERIAEVGYDAYRAEMEEKKRKIMSESVKDARARYAKSILERSGLGEKFFTRTFMTFRASPENEPAMTACIDIAEGNRVNGLIMSGPHGIGKTHLAAAVVNRLAARGVQAYFGNMVEIVDEVKDNFRTGTESVIAKMLSSRILVLDDLGAEHSAKDSGWIDSLLYKIVNRSYEGNKTLVITTNLDGFDFAKRYNARIVSRLREMCDWVRYEECDARIGLEPTDEKMPF